MTKNENKSQEQPWMPTEAEIMLPFLSVVDAFRKGGFDFTNATAGMVFVILAFIRPGANQKDIAAVARLTKPVVSRSCHYLQDHGLVTLRNEGHSKCCVLTPKGQRLRKRVLLAVTNSVTDLSKRHAPPA